MQEWFDLSKQAEFQAPILNDHGKMVLPEMAKKRKRPTTTNEELIEEEEENIEWIDGKPKYMVANNGPLSKEYIAALERFYWRNLSFQETMYGADLPGSLFEHDDNNKWDVSRLENLLSSVGTDLPGVTTPYLYFGLYKSTFSWHVEDMDLFSIK